MFAGSFMHSTASQPLYFKHEVENTSSGDDWQHAGETHAARSSPWPLCCSIVNQIQINLRKSGGETLFDWKSYSSLFAQAFLGLTPAIRSVDTRHESFMVLGREVNNMWCTGAQSKRIRFNRIYLYPLTVD